MDPNQNNPIQPIPQEPVSFPPATTPEVQPSTAPQAPQYFTAPVVEYPQQPQPQPIAVNPFPATQAQQPAVQQQSPVVVTPQAIVAAPQVPAGGLQSNVVNNSSNHANKKRLKVFLIISAIVLAIAGIGIAVWLLFFNTLALKEYSNDEYSILVPESYKNVGYGSSIKFEKPNKESGYKSSVSVNVIDIPDGLRDELVSELKKQFTKESFESGGSMASFQDTSKVEVKDSKKDDMDVRTATGNVLDGDKTAGKFKVVLIISSNKAYTIAIMSHSTEPKLAASADAIINSFKEK